MAKKFKEQEVLPPEVLEPMAREIYAREIWEAGADDPFARKYWLMLPEDERERYLAEAAEKPRGKLLS